MALEWEEEPFEWVSPHRFSVRRHYAAGPIDRMTTTLELAPRADVSKLRFDISGADGMRIASDGDLLLRVGRSDLRMKTPEVYDEWPGPGPPFLRPTPHPAPRRRARAGR